MDKISREARSEVMRKVKNKNTRPELMIRRLLHGRGLRFRLHRSDLPGKPDIVFPKHNKILLVHGCFWHRHEQCKRATTPTDNADYWRLKFERNVARDREVIAALSQLGWSVRVVWECEIKDRQTVDGLIDEIVDWLKRAA